jgi:hypothetical protein
MTDSALQFRPLHKRDFQIFRRLSSPIFQRIQQGLSGKLTADTPTPYTASEGAEMIYQLTRPISEVEATLKRGRAHFRLTAAKAVNVTDDEGKAMIERIVAAIVRFGDTRGKDCTI